MVRVWAIVVGLIFVGLLVLPSTAPYLRWQVLAPFYYSPSLEMLSQTDQERKKLSQWLSSCRLRYPNDLEVQVGCLLSQGIFLPNEVSAQRLDALINQFPQEPALYLLRISQLGGSLRFMREESLARQTESPPPPQMPDPNQVRRLLQLLDRAEQLDPDNGYFLAMRAMVLYANKRDAEGLRALERAGDSPRWDTYNSFIVRALQTTHSRCLGVRGSLPMSTVYAVQLFPDMAKLREVARTVVGLALRAESRGNLREGVRLRMALARLGALMRAEGATIESLVGIAITSIASGSFRENWQPPRSVSASGNTVHWRRTKFLNALIQHGFRQEAQWFRSEFERINRARTIVRKALRQVMDRQILIPMVWLTFWVGVGLVLQGGVLASAAMWLSAVVVHRWLGGRWWLVPIVGIGASVAWAFSPAGDGLVACGESLRGVFHLIGGAQAQQILERLPLEPSVLRWISFAGVLLMGVLLPGVVLFIVWLTRRDSPAAASSAMVRWLGRISLVWLTIYVIGLGWIWFRDRQLESTIATAYMQETRFFAKHVGMAWPGRE